MAQVEKTLEQVIRLFTILHRVAARRAGTGIDREDLAEACECTVRTVGRAVKALREARIPLEYDRAERTYFLPDKS